MTAINMRHLRAFCAVADMRHFTKAAESIYLSQPALSSLVQQVEEELGVVMLTRNTRNVCLTEVGKEFHKSCKKLIFDFDNALNDAKDYARLKKGRVRLAVLPSLCATFIPQVLNRFRARYPTLNVKVQDATGERILDALRSKTADIGISYVTQARDFESEILYEDKLVLLCPPEIVPNETGHLSWRDLADLEIIAMEKGTTVRWLSDIAAAKAGIELNIVLEAQQMATAINYVVAGLGCAILPSLGIKALGLERLNLFQLDPPTMRTISLIYYRDVDKTPTMRAMSQMIADELAGVDSFSRL